MSKHVTLDDHPHRVVTWDELKTRWPSCELYSRSTGKRKKDYELALRIPEGWDERERDLWILKRLALAHGGDWKPLKLVFDARPLTTYERETP